MKNWGMEDRLARCKAMKKCVWVIGIGVVLLTGCKVKQQETVRESARLTYHRKDSMDIREMIRQLKSRKMNIRHTQWAVRDTADIPYIESVTLITVEEDTEEEAVSLTVEAESEQFVYAGEMQREVEQVYRTGVGKKVIVVLLLMICCWVGIWIYKRR